MIIRDPLWKSLAINLFYSEVIELTLTWPLKFNFPIWEMVVRVFDFQSLLVKVWQKLLPALNLILYFLKGTRNKTYLLFFMKVESWLWTPEKGWISSGKITFIVPQWLLIFGQREALQNTENLQFLRDRFPGALFTGCSTAGEISGNQVTDGSILATAIEFEDTIIRQAESFVVESVDSFRAGEQVMEELALPGLRHVFVLSDGVRVNGSELVAGLRSVCPEGVQITGGMAADGADFKRTVLIGNSKRALEGKVLGVGFYGDRLKVGQGSFGGWEPFGLERYVTKSERNVLYELDGTPALEVYKTYIGRNSYDLPASALQYPLSISSESDESGLVRTILSVNEKDQSMTFAGDIPEGSYVRLMKANNNQLVDGARLAARSCKNGSKVPSSLAILISCVGRKLVMKNQVADEVAEVNSVLGDGVTTTGFYSYGEISPFSKEVLNCELHNQTMTITTFLEE